VDWVVTPRRPPPASPRGRWPAPATRPSLKAHPHQPLQPAPGLARQRPPGPRPGRRRRLRLVRLQPRHGRRRDPAPAAQAQPRAGLIGPRPRAPPATGTGRAG
jgi:hypothetical protein